MRVPDPWPGLLLATLGAALVAALAGSFWDGASASEPTWASRVASTGSCAAMLAFAAGALAARPSRGRTAWVVLPLAFLLWLVVAISHLGRVDAFPPAVAVVVLAGLALLVLGLVLGRMDLRATHGFGAALALGFVALFGWFVVGVTLLRRTPLFGPTPVLSYVAMLAALVATLLLARRRASAPFAAGAFLAMGLVLAFTVGRLLLDPSLYGTAPRTGLPAVALSGVAGGVAYLGGLLGTRWAEPAAQSATSTP